MSNAVRQIGTRVPRFAEAAVERARLQVVPRTHQHASRGPFLVVVAVLLLGGVVGLLLFNTHMQQSSFQVRELERQAATAVGRQQTLQMEVAQLRDPQRVASAARRMNMVIPSVPAFLSLDGSVTGVPTPATAADGIRLNAPPKGPGQARAGGKKADTRTASPDRR